MIILLTILALSVSPVGVVHAVVDNVEPERGVEKQERDGHFPLVELTEKDENDEDQDLGPDVAISPLENSLDTVDDVGEIEHVSKEGGPVWLGVYRLFDEKRQIEEAYGCACCPTSKSRVVSSDLVGSGKVKK